MKCLRLNTNMQKKKKKFEICFGINYFCFAFIMMTINFVVMCNKDKQLLVYYLIYAT